MPDHVMRHPWSTPGHPLKAHQAAPNHVRWGIWVSDAAFMWMKEKAAACGLAFDEESIDRFIR